jgi:hypothetical protein
LHRFSGDAVVHIDTRCDAASMQKYRVGLVDVQRLQWQFGVQRNGNLLALSSVKLADV